MANELDDYLKGLTKVAEAETALTDAQIDALYGLDKQAGPYSSGTHGIQDWPDSAKGTIAAKARPATKEELKEQAITYPDKEKKC